MAMVLLRRLADEIGLPVGDDQLSMLIEETVQVINENKGKFLPELVELTGEAA